MNPARTFSPDVITGNINLMRAYVAGPFAASFLAVPAAQILREGLAGLPTLASPAQEFARRCWLRASPLPSMPSPDANASS